jgi:hypothetical protein
VTHSGGGPDGGTDFLTPTGSTGFSADFSASKTLVVDFLAPEGEQFVYTPTASGNFMEINLDFGEGQDTFASVLSAGFLGDSGQGPTDFVTSWATNPDGINFGIGSYDIPTSFSFTGFSATLEVPAGDSDQFANVTPYVLNFQFGNQFSDPGQQVTMAPVATPEPSTLALAGLGGLATLLYRRRK